MKILKLLVGTDELRFTRIRLVKVPLTIAGLVSFSLLTGCASQTVLVEHDELAFKGDVQPMVSSSEALIGNISNLTEGEALIVGKARDGSGALARPNLATVSVVESQLGKRKLDTDLVWERCDPDGDGILDFYCPELLAAMEDDELELRKFVMFQSSYLISTNKKIDEDYWTSSAQIDISKEKASNIPIYLKLMAVNRGNKIFEGDLTVYAQLPAQVLPGEITEATKIKDKTSTKSFLSAIPYLNFITLGMDNFSVVKSIAEFETSIDDQGHARLTVKDITLEPGEGINLEYSTIYPMGEVFYGAGQ